MQESENSHDERYDEENLRYVVEAEYVDSLRGAFILSIVKIGIATAIIAFVFLQYGSIVTAVGVVLAFLVALPAVLHLQRYFLYISRRNW